MLAASFAEDQHQCLPISDEELQAMAPTTVVYSPDGTRRQAALAGIDPHSDHYVHWLHERMLESLDVLFQMNVSHVFQGLLRSTHFAERSAYRERLLGWVQWFLSGPEAMEAWHRRGWRVRLIGADDVPELQHVAARLRADTPVHAEHTIWFYLHTSLDAQWSAILRAARQIEQPTISALTQALYGESITPATIYISSGKTLIAPDSLPLAVVGEMHCYWMQRPGYTLDRNTFLRILADALYARRTWTADKTSRYCYVHEQRALLESSRVLGLGQRVGPFWYPDSHELSLLQETLS